MKKSHAGEFPALHARAKARSRRFSVSRYARTAFSCGACALPNRDAALRSSADRNSSRVRFHSAGAAAFRQHSSTAPFSEGANRRVGEAASNCSESLAADEPDGRGAIPSMITKYRRKAARKEATVSSFEKRRRHRKKKAL